MYNQQISFFQEVAYLCQEPHHIIEVEILDKDVVQSQTLQMRHLLKMSFMKCSFEWAWVLMQWQNVKIWDLIK